MKDAGNGERGGDAVFRYSFDCPNRPSEIVGGYQPGLDGGDLRLYPGNAALKSRVIRSHPGGLLERVNAVLFHCCGCSAVFWSDRVLAGS